MSLSRVALTPKQRALIERARRAVLGTTRADGRPRLVPLAFAISDAESEALVIYSALDEKPKSIADPRQLGRVRDVLARPLVSLLVDEWNEDWSALEWLRLDGSASLLEPGHRTEHAQAVALLRARYPQYAGHRLEQRPVLRIVIERVTGWSAVG